jgi:heterodisulfide reductase subunit B
VLELIKKTTVPLREKKNNNTNPASGTCTCRISSDQSFDCTKEPQVNKTKQNKKDALSTACKMYHIKLKPSVFSLASMYYSFSGHVSSSATYGTPPMHGYIIN